MVRSFSRQRSAELVAAFFILLFAYTALSKFWAFRSFQLNLSRSPLVAKAAPAAAVLIPLAELFICLPLFFPRTRKAGLAAAAVLMVVFTLYVAWMMLWAPYLPCSCGGITKYMGWRAHLVFNLLAAALAFAGWRLEEGPGPRRVRWHLPKGK